MAQTTAAEWEPVEATDDDVSWWRPQWRNEVPLLLTEQRERLRGLVGRRIDQTWIAWNEEHDKWVAGLPVVLGVEGQRLEVCTRGLDRLSITWDTIDVEIAPRGHFGPATVGDNRDLASLSRQELEAEFASWVQHQLRWRRDAHPLLRRAVGQLIERVVLVEYRFAPREVFPEPGRQALETWKLVGIGFYLEAGQVYLFNAMDDNGLSEVVPVDSSDIRIVQV